MRICKPHLQDTIVSLTQVVKEFNFAYCNVLSVCLIMNDHLLA